MRLLNFVLALLVVALLVWPSLHGAVLLNGGYIDLLQAGLVTASAAPAALGSLEKAVAAGQSSGLWGLGLLARWQGDEARSRKIWERELALTPRSIPLLRIFHPQDEALAQQSRLRYPQYSLTGFWLGEALADKDVAAALAVYEETIAQDPADGVRWVELGILYLRHGESDKALAAYDRGCRLRDIGGNGCWRAGLLSEELGQNAEAIHYYQLTLRQIPNYAPALERLVGLEEEAKRDTD